MDRSPRPGVPVRSLTVYAAHAELFDLESNLLGHSAADKIAYVAFVVRRNKCPVERRHPQGRVFEVQR